MRTFRLLSAVALLFLVATNIEAQPLRVTLNVSSHPNPYLSAWSSRREIAIVTIVNPGTSAVQAKFDVRLSVGGQQKAATNPNRMRVISIPPGTSQYYGEDLVPYSAVDFTGSGDRTAVRTGRLPAGVYTFCVSLLDAKSLQRITEPVCRNFTIVSYTSPIPIQPADRSTVQRGKLPLFTWTAVAPKPPGRVLYRLVVFEVLAGQTPVTAFRSNRPIIDKEGLVSTQMLWPTDYEKPEEGRTYVWGVIATDGDGNRIGEPNDGVGGPVSFSIAGGTPRPGGTRDTLTSGPGTSGAGTSGGGGGGAGTGGTGGGGTGSGGAGSGGGSGTPTGAADARPVTSGAGAPFSSTLGRPTQAPRLIGTSPRDGERFEIDSRTRPSFQWEWQGRAPEVRHYEIEVRRAEDKTGRTQRTTAMTAAWPAGLEYVEGAYVWRVTATGTDNNPVGSTGWMAFSVVGNQYDIDLIIDSVLCGPTPNVYLFYGRLVNQGTAQVTLNSAADIYAWSVGNVPDPLLTLNLTTPSTYAVPIPPSTTQQLIGTLTSTGATVLQGIYVITKPVAGPDITEFEPGDTLPNCLCDACETIKIDTTGASVQLDTATGDLTISQPLVISPDPLVSMTAEIIYVRWEPKDPLCMPCTRNQSDWGTLVKATLTTNSSPVAGPTTASSAGWTMGSPQTPTVGTASFTIGFPTVLECCEISGRVCIRYRFNLKSPDGTDCYQCDRVICYTF